jgi:hypothetical protein
MWLKEIRLLDNRNFKLLCSIVEQELKIKVENGDQG